MTDLEGREMVHYSHYFVIFWVMLGDSGVRLVRFGGGDQFFFGFFFSLIQEESKGYVGY